MRNLKAFIALTFLLIQSSISFSQKYIDGDRTQLTYTKFPTDYAIQDDSTYYVVFEGTIHGRSGLSKYANLPGFILMGDRTKADILLVINQTNYENTGKHLDKNSRTKKNKDGSTTTITNYYYKTTFKIAFDVKLVGNNGAIIENFHGYKEDSYTSKARSTIKEASQEFDNNVTKQRDNIANEAFKNAMHKLKDKYCFTKDWVKASFVGFKFKKNDYTELNEIAIEASSFLKSDLTDETKARLTSFIEIWKRESNEYDANDSKARINDKIQAGLLYNIALAYFFMEDFANASDYFNKATELNKTVQNYQPNMLKDSKRNAENTI